MKLVLLVALGVVAVSAEGWRKLGDLSGDIMVRSMHDVCQMKKVTDQCVEWDDHKPPYCFEEDCKFVPQYGEEVTNFWGIWFDWLNSGKNKKYREILDLGEHMTKSHDAVVCENENMICDCDDLDDCACKRDDHVKVCKQKYTYKYGFYWVANTYLCKRSYGPWHYFWKMLTGNQRHFTSVELPAAMPPSVGYKQPQSQNWQYVMHYLLPLLKREKHSHLGELIPCSDQPKPAYSYPKPTHPNSYSNYYNLDMNQLVKYAFLKIKVPSGCECEEL